MAHNDLLIDLDVARTWLNRASSALSGGEDSAPEAVAYAHAAAMIGHGFVGLAHTARSFEAMAEASTLTARQIAAVDALTDEIHAEPSLGAAIARERQALAEARPPVVDLSSLPFLGFTEDGHPIGGPVPDDVQVPGLVARCGGPGVCGVCAGDVTAAVRKHQLAESVREAGRG